jgi:hypothetical protein
MLRLPKMPPRQTKNRPSQRENSPRQRRPKARLLRILKSLKLRLASHRLA